jgi:hypothetical protein
LPDEPTSVDLYGPEIEFDPNGTQNIVAPEPGKTSIRGAAISIEGEDDQEGEEDEDDLEEQSGQGDEDEEENDDDDDQDPKEIELFGKKHKSDELQEIISKGENYTREMQLLRQKERELEPVTELDAYLKRVPQQAREHLFSYARQIDQALATGQPLPTAAASASQPTPLIKIGDVDPEDLSQEGRAIYGLLQHQMTFTQQLAQQNALLTRQIQEMGGVLPEVRQTLSEVRGDKAAIQEATALKEEYGAEIAPDQLRALAAKHKTGDNLRAAWLQENQKALLEGAFKKGKKTAEKPKPRTPDGGRSRTLNVKEHPGMSTDQVFAAMRNGADAGQGSQPRRKSKK